MSRSRVADALVVGVFAIVSFAALGIIAARPVSGSPPDHVDVHIRYSHYEPDRVVVPFGRPVTIVLHNDDPIEHEWIVGDDELHARHRTGTEQHHGARPTEVSVPALTTIETVVTFAQPVTWQYICHLPGHEQYGMVGFLEAE